MSSIDYGIPPKRTSARSVISSATEDSNDVGQTCIIAAARQGNLDAVKVLTQQGAKISKQDNFGYTALHMASYYGKLGIVRFLLSFDGATVDTRALHGFTPLHLAVIQCHADVVRTFLSAPRIDIFVKDRNHWTPLHWAAFFDYEHIVGMFLSIRTIVDALRGGTSSGFTVPVQSVAQGKSYNTLVGR